MLLNHKSLSPGVCWLPAISSYAISSLCKVIFFAKLPITISFPDLDISLATEFLISLLSFDLMEDKNTSFRIPCSEWKNFWWLPFDGKNRRMEKTLHNNFEEQTKLSKTHQAMTLSLTEIDTGFDHQPSDR